MELKQLPPPPPAQGDWAYFIDYDGTLVEIAATPGAVRMDDALPALLASVQRACGGAVAVISGRALADLERRIGLPGLAKAGQHGLERGDAAGGLWMQPNLVPLKSKQSVLNALVPILEHHPGLLLEDKGMTLALHYRLAPELSSFAQRIMRELVARSGVGLVVQDGKCIVEVKPADIDKGTTVAAYLAEPPFLHRRPVFIGDDSTDEHGFAAVNARGGISIGVGIGCINARYTLPDVSAVRAWLAGLQDRDR
jgi:trehalose 6-phosphate phosphatase